MLSLNCKHVQHVKICLPCNFEVNPVTHFGVISLFSSNFQHFNTFGPLLAHLTQRVMWGIAITWRPSYVVNFHILIFSSETTGPIATKPLWLSWLMWQLVMDFQSLTLIFKCGNFFCRSWHAEHFCSLNFPSISNSFWDIRW